jgi:hypothetical protein
MAGIVTPIVSGTIVAITGSFYRGPVFIVTVAAYARGVVHLHLQRYQTHRIARGAHCGKEVVRAAQVVYV